MRLLDYLDIHAYVAPDDLPSKHDGAKPEADALRLRSTSRSTVDADRRDVEVVVRDLAGVLAGRVHDALYERSAP